MNDYETLGRFPYTSIRQYGFSSGDRNAPAFLSHAARPDFRGCPLTSRNRSTSGRDLEEQGGGPPRRRIAVACARCRKRKIRCSGDQGNGQGCSNCRNAGADITQCQFHRVGSGEAFSVMSVAGAGPLGGQYTSTIASGHSNTNSMLPIYSASSPVYHRAFPPSQYPSVNTKSAYVQPWTPIAFTDDSPIESYGLGSTTCMIGQDSMAPIYTTPDSSLRWSQMPQKANANGVFMDHETPSTTYTSSNLPYLTMPIGRSTAPTESFSPLNMTSLNSTLPVPLTDRQLPIPPSIRPQSSAAVDQVQTRALPTTQGTLGTAVSSTGTHTKAAMPWAGEGAMTNGRPSSITSSSSGEIAAPAPSRPYAAAVSAAEPVLGYVPVTGTNSPELSPTSTAPSTTYSTTSASDSVPVTSLSSSFSNINQQTVPVSGSGETSLSRQDSCSNLYAYIPDNSSKRNSLGEVSSTEGRLMNGQRYAPLGQPQSQPQHAVSVESLRRDSFEHRTSLAHRASVSSINHIF